MPINAKDTPKNPFTPLMSKSVPSTQVLSAMPHGIDALPVRIGVAPSDGNGNRILGLSSKASADLEALLAAAFESSELPAPGEHFLVQVPHDLPPGSVHLNLGLAAAFLAAHDELSQGDVDGRMLVGDLDLNGSLRPIRGAIAIAELAAREGVAELLVPQANAHEASYVKSNGGGSLKVIGVPNLRSAVDHLTGKAPLPPGGCSPGRVNARSTNLDLADVRGQDSGKRALEIAAAGGHNLLFVGPPGVGKTMLARRLAGLLPPLDREEAIEVTKIHSLISAPTHDGLMRERPFRSPHSSASRSALVGGGVGVPRPGEATLAHHGVLFLDELTEFRRDAQEALRQPLEEGQVTIARSDAEFTFPARFSLVAAMNPCPCGHLGDPRHECRCAPGKVERYRSRVPRTLLACIDLNVEIGSVAPEDLRRRGGEPTASVAERVEAARRRQAERFRSLAEDCNREQGPAASAKVNSALTARNVDEHCRLDSPSRSLMDSAFERLDLSAREVHRILRVARTIADLADAEEIRAPHLAEAIQYRCLDRKPR